MRLAAMLFAAAILAAPPALAQQPPPPEQTAPQAAPTQGAQRFAHALLTESNMLPVLLDAMKAQMMPDLKAKFVDLPAYRDLSQADRTRLLAYIDRLPDLIVSEMSVLLPQIETHVAHGFDRRFTPTEAESIAVFFESPGGASFMRRAMGAGVRAAASGDAEDAKYRAAGELVSTMTPEETQAIVSFSATEGFRAFSRESESLGQVVEQVLEEHYLPLLKIKIRADMCREFGEKYCISI